MSRSLERRRRWFTQGVQAVERVTGRKPEGYLCPLCLRWCTSIEDVRPEHAPPASVGGRQVALTCDDCNHGAGHRLEGELRKAEDLREWAHQRPSKRPLRGELEYDGIALRMESQWVDGRLEIAGIPRQNDPAKTAAHVAALERTPNRFVGSEFRLHYPAPEWRRVHVAWLKSAYMVAFALLGYQWALRSALDIVRTQIAEPETEHIERFYLPRRSGSSDQQVVTWIDQPASLESVFVVMNDHAVFLPGLKRSPRTYELLAERKSWPLRARTFRAVRATGLGWPSGPELRFDQLEELNRKRQLAEGDRRAPPRCPRPPGPSA